MMLSIRIHKMGLLLMACLITMLQGCVLPGKRPPDPVLEQASKLLREGENREDKQDYHEAIDYYDRAIALVQNRMEPTREHALALIRRAHCLFNLEKWDEAYAYYEIALTKMRSFHGNNHPSVAHALIGLGQVLMKTKRFEEALPRFQAAVAIMEANAEERTNGLPDALHNLALCFEELDRYDDAITATLRELELFADKQATAQRQVRAATINEGEELRLNEGMDLSLIAAPAEAA